MIFVTVGSQLPFDRLVRTVDDWAGRTGRRDVFAQIGNTAWRPTHIQWAYNLSPQEYRERLEEADAVVAHAGTGTILAALELAKPIIVLPRRGDLMETRNEHQVATAKRFVSAGRVVAAYDEQELAEQLDRLDELPAASRISNHASPRLLHALRAFVEGEAVGVPAADVDLALPLPAGPVAREMAGVQLD